MSADARDGSEAVRFVSGMAALPSWIRDVDGVLPELLAVAVLVAVIVLIWAF
jgi:hypothetical protein